ncbi:hypothetical protein F441_22399 [Phytophthora nicotianae CJ01A1]|uniref:Uncharacterized protein n=1 Tax=Phytophthora nicotianae CJ01A1 TaxID=1317063 RepID=W2VPS5_PHYNI|nr:hypothetical protein F441_22399 [Phytophthora nicotianae CJ01A1]
MALIEFFREITITSVLENVCIGFFETEDVTQELRRRGIDKDEQFIFEQDDH